MVFQVAKSYSSVVKGKEFTFSTNACNSNRGGGANREDLLLPGIE